MRRRQGRLITRAASGRRTTYGAVAFAANAIAPPADVPLKDPKDWTVAGKPLNRLDTLDKLNGSLVYGVDFTMPGMLVALPKACPVHGGKLKSFDAAAVSGMRGVRHVLRVDDETVAVVADTFWRAKTALDALPVVGRGAGRGGVERDHRRDAARGPDGGHPLCGQPRRRREGCAGAGAARHRGRLQLPLPASRPHGGALRHRPVAPGAL